MDSQTHSERVKRAAKEEVYKKHDTNLRAMFDELKAIEMKRAILTVELEDTKRRYEVFKRSGGWCNLLD